MIFFRIQLLLVTVLFFSVASLPAADDLDRFDEEVRQWAVECRTDIVTQFDLLLTSGQLSVPQLFDTFYIPIPNTDPQKFRTQYDNLSDGVVRPIIDKILGFDERLVFVVIVDRNGYLPTHNSRYSRPLTDNPDENTKWNRTKRMFNDRTGLAAARNQKPYLLQRYSRDTGETMGDLSVPIMIQNRHWGAVRIGYKKD
ncbi:chemotaxis protein [uncultured Desulfuromusa sp.]|uniref:chemotaxis protein n=1 Tax=uncultured Desulfuromusa sp. TaxID=219183 RepID=UPI002AA89572|nr:chemotaxis protein [uncultured Desulfuromusa sp.]